MAERGGTIGEAEGGWRREDTLVRAAVGALVGVLVLKVVALLFLGGFEGPDGLWSVAFLIMVAVAWGTVRHGRDTVASEGRDPLLTLWLSAALVALAALTVVTFPADAFRFFLPSDWSPSPRDVSMWAGTAVFTVITAALLVVGRAPRGTSGRRGALSVAAGLVTVLLVAIGCVHVSQYRFTDFYQPTEYTVAEPGGPAGFPEGVSRVGWEWNLPPKTEIEWIEVGTRGPLLGLSDGVVALDGATGEELWSFRRPYDGALRSRATLDGEQVHVRWRTRTGSSGEELLTVFDADGGERLSEGPVPDHLEEWEPEVLGRWILSGVEIVLDHREEATRGRFLLEARHPVSGESMWDHPLVDDEGCAYTPEAGGNSLLVGEVLVLSRVCWESGEDESTWVSRGEPEGEARTRVIALEVDTGREAWRWEVPYEEEYASYRAPTRVAEGRVSEGEEPVLMVGSYTNPEAFLDVATGEEVLENPEEEERDIGDYVDTLRMDTGGSVFLEEVTGEDDGTSRFRWYRRDAEGRIGETVTVGGGERQLLYGYENSMALNDENALMPYLGVGGELAVLSVPLGGGAEDAEWIEIAGLGTVREPAEVGHDLLAVPGAVISYLSRSGTPDRGEAMSTIYGLVP